MEIHSATILGSGNVAFHLGKALAQNGIRVDAVYSPNETHAISLAEQLNTQAFSKPDKLPLSSDIYIIAVKDTVIEQVSDQLADVAGLVVHTSGNTSMEVLSKHKRCGVFYPLQTISKQSALNFTHVPVLLETKQQDDMALLKQLTTALGATSYEVDSDKRKVVHVAAVFANNFSNHLYGIAQQILIENNLSFEMLKPLIRETANNIQHYNPNEVQTGPAVRGDQTTINTHLKLLKEMPGYAQLYTLLSQSIINTHKEK
ncbi:MAG: DUF2520 domain-containing protein [Bacteroidota bacterium]